MITASGTGNKGQWEVTAQSWDCRPGEVLSKRQRQRRPREVASSPRTHSSVGIRPRSWLAQMPWILARSGREEPLLGIKGLIL